MSIAVPRLLPALLATIALAVSGCGGDDGDEAAAPASPAATAPAAADAAGGARGTGRATAGRQAREPKAQTAAADLANFSCTQRTGGVWSASGDVTNSGSAPMVYTVTVVTVEGAEVAGEESEQLLLEPGESTGFELAAISRGSADACMPRVLRTPR